MTNPTTLRTALAKWSEFCECGWQPEFVSWTASPCTYCADLRSILEAPASEPLQVGSFPVKVVIDPKMPPDEMVMSNSLGQSVRVTGLHDPLPPEILADALEACGSHGPNDVIGCELPKGHSGLCEYEDPRADWEK